MVDSGIILVKYWLEMSQEEQTRRIDDGRKTWKLSPMDLEPYSRWYDHSRARDEMFEATDAEWAPWFVARSDDKRRARLNVISHHLRRVPDQQISRPAVHLPEHQECGDYQEPDYPYRWVPDRF